MHKVLLCSLYCRTYTVAGRIISVAQFAIASVLHDALIDNLIHNEVLQVTGTSAAPA